MSSSSECNCAGESPSSNGSTPKPSRRYEVGDEVELTVRVVSLDFDGDVIVETIGASKDAVRNWMHPCQLDAGRLKPRPIKVGDRVCLFGEYGCADVLGVAFGKASLHFTDRIYEPFVVVEVSQLVKV